MRLQAARDARRTVTLPYVPTKTEPAVKSTTLAAAINKSHLPSLPRRNVAERQPHPAHAFHNLLLTQSAKADAHVGAGRARLDLFRLSPEQAPGDAHHALLYQLSLHTLVKVSDACCWVRQVGLAVWVSRLAGFVWGQRGAEGVSAGCGLAQGVGVG